MSKRPTQPGPLTSESEALFELGRASHSPTAADRARVRAALARKLADVPAEGSGGWSVRVSGGRARIVTVGNLVKLGIGVACLVAGTFIATRGVGTKPPAPPPMQTLAAAAPPVPEPVRASSTSAVPTLQREMAAENVTQPSARPSAKRLKAKRVPLPMDSVGSAATGSAPEAHDGVQATEVDKGAPRPQPSAADVTSEPQLRPQAQPSAPVPMEQTEGHSAVRNELALVTRIHAALRDGQPRTALTLCAEHQQRWPNGMFIQEREGLRAIAACNAGAAGAGALARAFVVNYPRAPLAARVRDACGARP